MATVLSIGLHVLAVVIVAWLAKEKVIDKPPVEVDVTFFSAPPPPPPPPPPASTTTKKKKTKKKKKIEKPPDPTPQELVQPEEIPEEIPEVEEIEAEEDEEVADAGVVGGVEGGVAGGVVGGVIGGKEDGVLGGDPLSLGEAFRQGRCRSVGQPRYPDMAKQMQIEGTVLLRGWLGENGKVLKHKDPACTQWANADKVTRRKYHHPNLCIWADSGPEALVYDTLMHYAPLRCQPNMSQGKPVKTPIRFPVIYRLK